MTEAIARISAAHKSARPNPVSNPAWANTHHDLSVVLSAFEAQALLIESLTKALEPFAKSKRGLEITINDLDRARTALASAQRAKEQL